MSDSSLSSLGTPSSDSTRHDQLRSIAQLAGLLNHLEVSGEPMHPAQYRLVAVRLHELLKQIEPGDDLNYVLATCPVAADVYENLRYEQAGLCLQPLSVIAQSEQVTRDLLNKIASL